MTLPPGEGAFGAPVALAEAEAGAFRRAQASFGGFSLSHRKGGAYGLTPFSTSRRTGARLPPSPATTRMATSTGPIVSHPMVKPLSRAAAGVLTAYDRAGNKLGDFVGHEGDVLAVAPSPDGRFLVSGAADQTVRLWNLKTRELLVTLFRGGGRRMGDVDAAGLLCFLARGRTADRLADQPWPGARGRVRRRRPAPPACEPAGHRRPRHPARLGGGGGAAGAWRRFQDRRSARQAGAAPAHPLA